LQVSRSNTVRPRIWLTEDREDRYLCAVTLFIALALSDNAIQGCDTFEDLEARRIACPDRYRSQIAPEKRDVPVFRTVTPRGTVSPDKMWKYASFNTLLKGAGQRAGYEERLTTYCFRRGFGFAIDSKLIIRASKEFFY
jgi:hypothetical protein